MSETMIALPGLPDPEAMPEAYDDTPTKRALAWVVDVAVIGGMWALATIGTLGLAVLALPLLPLIGFVYRWATLSRGSATWGMRLLGMEIRRHDGARLDPVTAFAHTAGYAVSVAMFPAQILSMGLMLVTPRRQGLSDHLLGTAAINRLH